MKNSIIRIAAIVSSLGALMLGVNAEDYSYGPYSVTYNGSAIVDTFGTDANVQSSISDIEPGDKAVFEIDVINSSNKNAEFWIKNDILRSFEDSKVASGGAYTYTLTYTPSTGGAASELYNSDRVGGEDNVGGVGLHEATTALKDYILLEDIAAGKKGKVTLTVVLDGESQLNNYQDQLAKINMRFAVETAEGETEPKHETIVTRREGNRIIYLPNTGDSSDILLYVSAFAASIVLMVIAVLKLKRAANQD